jgi:hypothetical protein
MRFLRWRDFLSSDSLLSRSSFETLNTCLRALSNRSDSVLPGTCGAGNGFIYSPVYRYVATLVLCLQTKGYNQSHMSFDDCWQRIARAEAHREAFYQAWHEFSDRKDAYTTVVSVDDNGAGRITIEPVSIFGLPPIASLELGEMLYQLRAALDASIYECAILETGKNPPPYKNALEFPVCRTPDEFTDASWKIKPLTGERRAIVESVQPYDIDKLSPQTAVHSHRRNLWIIYDWSRIDRHRRLHFVGSWATICEPTFVLPEGVSVASMFVDDSGFLEHQSEIARFKLAGWIPGMELETKFNPGISIDVAIDEPPPQCAPNDTTVNRLLRMVLTTRTIIQSLQDSFC